MKRGAIVLILFLAAGCSTGGDTPAPVVTPPSAAPVADEVSPDRRIDELQTALAEILERMDVMNARMQKLEAGTPLSEPVAAAAPAPAPAPVQAAASAPVQAAASAPVQAAAPAPPPAAHAAPSPAAAPVVTTSPLQGAAIADSYRNALMLYGKNNMPEARRALERVYQSDPTGELADNALYWIGETYYATGNYSEAVRFYQRVSAEYPNENKAPDALLKIGLVYVKTGDLLLARSTFQQLIDRYPYSTPAATARQELKRIKY